MNLIQRIKWAVQTAYITHSLDGEFYYIEWGDRRPRHWLSVATVPGEVPEEKKHGAFDGVVQIAKATGETYHRRSLPFAFWDVKSARDTAPIDKDNDLFLDYVAYSQWEI